MEEDNVHSSCSQHTISIIEYQLHIEQRDISFHVILSEFKVCKKN
jgi:hypothetical protein